jgi:hypothetical protein
VLDKAVPDDNGSKPGDVAKGEDVVIVHGATEDGATLGVIRVREQKVEVGALQRLEHGKPIHGEVVRLRPRQACPWVCDVEVALPDPRPRVEVEPTATPQAVSASRRGPAQVSSENYREGWELIFGGGGKSPVLN